MKKEKTNRKNALRDDQDEPIKKKRSPKKSKKSKSSKVTSMNLSLIKDERMHKILGVFFILFSLYLTLAFSSYVFSWFNWQTEDIDIGFSRVLFDNTIEVHNFMGRLGAALSMSFIKNGFGIASFLFIYLFFVLGFRLVFGVSLLSFKKALKHSLFGLVWISFTLGFLFRGIKTSLFGGVFGFELSTWSIGVLGKVGSFFLILFALASFLILAFSFHKLFQKQPEDDEMDEGAEKAIDEYSTEGLNIDDLAALEGIKTEEDNLSLELSIDETKDEEINSLDVDEEVAGMDLRIEVPKEEEITEKEGDDLELVVEQSEEEAEVGENQPESGHGIETEYDPTEDLRDFKNPNLDLLEDHGSSNEISMTREELEDNKNKIVKTLRDYAIEIKTIKATIGPTVTLYEIIPAAGVRISKIKNLEDDIALSLAAMGIRIIAPIPVGVQ